MSIRCDCPGGTIAESGKCTSCGVEGPRHREALARLPASTAALTELRDLASNGKAEHGKAEQFLAAKVIISDAVRHGASDSDLIALQREAKALGLMSKGEFDRVAREAREHAAQDEPAAEPPASAEDDREILPPPTNPMAVARCILPDWLHEGVPTLRNWRGTWMNWTGPHWAEAEEGAVRSQVYRRLEHSAYEAVAKDKSVETRPWAPSKRKVGDLLEAMAAITHLSSATDAPSWTDGRQPGSVVACANGLLRISDRALGRHDPRYFNLVSVPFEYIADVPEPSEWLRFLDTIWPQEPDDEDAAQNARDSISSLQEWFGYVISGRTDLHKIKLIVGPTRSGKGTIARILTALVGKGHMAGPTLASIASQFGLTPLLGKPLAIIADARLPRRDSEVVVERLLTISGEDPIDVDRKFKDPWTGRLPTRITILSNELPNFGDASGAIAHRFSVLVMTRSWLGKEDRTLDAKLTAELPGILNWALDGLDRLGRQGRFTEPQMSADAVVAMLDTASPTSAFVRDWCEVGPLREVTVDHLYKAWRAWCGFNGIERPGSKQIFGRNLQAAAPQVRLRRPRDGESRTRVYAGIALKQEAEETLRDDDPDESHNGAGRGPTRTSATQGQPATTPAAGVVRDGPRSIPLQLSHQIAICEVCGESMKVLEPGQVAHPNCEASA